ncbi:MAG: hypothetical protein QW482_03380 [Thermoproteota archaeon]
MRYGFLGRQKYIVTDEAVHTSVLKVIMPKQNASFYVMVLTPYPNTRYLKITNRPPFIISRIDLDARYENPSLLFSYDGVCWKEGIRNPIFLPPKDAKRVGGPHNYDPFLIWNPLEKKAFLFFINWGDRCKNIRLLISSNFRVWIDKGFTNIEVLEQDGGIRISPSIIYLKEDKKYYMLLVHCNLYMKEKPFVELFQSTNGLHWEKKNELDMSLHFNGSVFYPWHITIRKVGNEYWALASMNFGKLSKPPMYLFLFRSKDLVEWEAYENPVLKPNETGFDNNMIYHADLLVDNGIINIWYSGVSEMNKYSIGMTKGTLMDINYQNIQSNNLVTIDGDLCLENFWL